MSGRRGQVLLTILLIMLVFGVGTQIVKADPIQTGQEDSYGDGENSDGIQRKAEDFLLSEFDFDEIEKSIEQMFPGEKISFQDVVTSLISGEPKEAGETLLAYLGDLVAYEFRYNRHNLVYILLVALAASVFTNFAGVFQNRQISDISFYILYMLLITLCLTSFQTAASGMEERLDALVGFMRVLCPSYFLAVAFASGSTTSLFFYNIILFLIYVVELVIVRFLLPTIHVYIMVRVLGNLTGEDFLSELAELIKKAVTWVLRTLFACVVGINVVQGLLAPAIDSLKRSALTRTAEALPWVGNALGGAADIVFGTAVLIKNGIGMAGAVIAIMICLFPLIQMALMALMYKLGAVLVQPVSDKRITTCISGVSEGYEMMVKVIFTTGLLFLLTIAVVAASTS